MKRFFSYITFLLFVATSVSAQEIVSENCLTPRARIVPYNTSALAQTHGGVAIKSQYVRPVKEWTRSEDADAVVFTGKFTVPFAWLNRQAIVRVDEASGAYEVVMNGKKLGYTSNAFAPAEFDATKATHEDMNTIQIRLLKSHWSRKLESFITTDEPRVGEVYVVSQPIVRVRDVVHNTSVDLSQKHANVELGFVVKTESLNPKKARIHYEILAPDTTVVTYGHRDVELDMKREDTIKILTQIPYELTWCADMPVRYRLNLKTQIEGRYVEYQTHLLGFRDVKHSENGDFYINGIKTDLNYGNFDVHKITDKDILGARLLGYNALRFPAQAVPHEVYRMCDSLGMYVLAQVPISTRNSGISRRINGNESNNPKWKKAFILRAENTYHATRNYSCVLGYLLADESSNGINLYESYIRLKALEPKRPIIYIEANGEWNSD